MGFHAVSRKMEKRLLVKSYHGETVGDKGYFRVSCHVVIIEVPWKVNKAHHSLKI